MVLFSAANPAADDVLVLPLAAGFAVQTQTVSSSFQPQQTTA